LISLGVTSVTPNRAARDGGGIYTRDDCVVNLLGLSNYQGNSAGDTGGGISAFRSNINLMLDKTPSTETMQWKVEDSMHSNLW